jgi:branched-chain amino acid transport system ATP-binding protein
MTALLEARGISTGYDGQPVVRDRDITFDAGRVVALLGPNGAGKTMTVLTLAGELSAVAGELVMDGVRAPAGTFRRAHRGLSLVTE